VTRDEWDAAFRAWFKRKIAARAERTAPRTSAYEAKPDDGLEPFRSGHAWGMRGAFCIDPLPGPEFWAANREACALEDRMKAYAAAQAPIVKVWP